MNSGTAPSWATSKSRKRIVHNVILILLFIWLGLVFFCLEQQTDNKISYNQKWEDFSEMRSIVLKRKSARPLNLLRGLIPSRHLNSQTITSSNVSLDESKAKQSLTCDLSHFRTDVCYLNGDVRVRRNKVTLFHKSSSSRGQHKVVAKIKPYTRKWEKSCMDTIGKVYVEESSHHHDHHHRDHHGSTCTVNHTVTAVIFSTGGYTGNVYHEFNDGLIPLFITSQEFKGEVVFMILELHDWWMMKYGRIVEKLSKYPVIDFDKNKEVHCFPKVIVGLKIHDELTVNHTLMEDGKGMRDFQSLVKDAFENSTNIQTPEYSRKPKMVLIARKSSRVLLNQNAVLKLASNMGFDVRTLSPNSRTDLSEVHRVLQDADVMVGVHGAALTHFLFMRPGSVFIQIIPLGTEWPAYTYYGEPAIKAGLQYIEYKILPDESSLVRKYGRNHTAVTHPEKVTAQGWWEMKKIYLESQDVKLLVPRFKPVLKDALRRVKPRGYSAV